MSVTGNALTMSTGTVTVSAAANVDVTGNGLTLATKGRYGDNMEWNSSRRNNGLDTNRTLLIWHQVFLQIQN